jgi:hypothetical protein
MWAIALRNTVAFNLLMAHPNIDVTCRITLIKANFL